MVADHATQLVDVTITVNPGRQAAFGDIIVTGTERMDPDFVRRQTGLTVGEEYDPDELVLAQRRLDRLEVFRAARLEAACNAHGVRLIEAEVRSARTGRSVKFA